MSIQKTGDWRKARRILEAAPRRVRATAKVLPKREAERLRSKIVEVLVKEAPGGRPVKPLSPLTLAAREWAAKRGRTALFADGDLTKAISVLTRTDGAFVGIPRRRRNPSGEHLSDIARIQEFGAGPIVVPMTPALRRFLFALLKQSGQPRRPGRGGKVVIIHVPARPFLRPSFAQYSKDAPARLLKQIASLLHWGD